MANIKNSLYNMRFLDDSARKKTFIHRLHPLVKLLTTLIYLTVVISFGKYEISNLLPFVFYPVLIFTLAELPAIPILKAILLIEPIIIGIGILNPLFDNHTMVVGSIMISRGWITFLSIFIKYNLTSIVSILLITTTGIDKIAAALRMLKIPKIFVLQLLLTYRYISVLLEEVSRMHIAYSLRAPRQKGIHPSTWGSFIGQLIIRTFERAQRVYQSMNLRGFTGEYNTGDTLKLSFKDYAYLLGWSLFFLFAKFFNIPILLGSFFTGVIK